MNIEISPAWNIECQNESIKVMCGAEERGSKYSRDNLRKEETYNN